MIIDQPNFTQYKWNLTDRDLLDYYHTSRFCGARQFHLGTIKLISHRLQGTLVAAWLCDGASYKSLLLLLYQRVAALP